MISLLTLFLAGACGALVKEIISDNKIVLPKKVDGELALGFLGSCFVGGVAGYLVDGNPVTAGLAGYAGLSAIENLLLKKNGQPTINQLVTTEIIRKIAKEEGVDPELAVRVAECESNLNPKAVNVNKGGDRDRGLFQINSKYHPDISDEDAFDPIFSAKFFCKAFKNNNLSWWNATKDCWEK